MVALIILYTFSLTTEPANSFLRGHRDELLEALVGNYLWVRNIIRYDTIRKPISVNPPPHLLTLVLFICGIWEDHQSRWLCLQNVSLLLCRTQKVSSSFNRTHCFLMVGNRDKKGEGHTWAQCRREHLSATSTECPHVCLHFHGKWWQEVRSPPTISKQSLYSNLPGVVPKFNQWHLSALWKKPIMGWGSEGSEGRRGRC